MRLADGLTDWKISTMLWAKICPPSKNSYVEILSPAPQDVTIFGEGSLRGN